MQAQMLKDSTSRKDQFIVTDIGYFISFYKERSIDIEDYINQKRNKTIFQNIYIFKKRVVDSTILNSNVKANLQSYFYSEALRQYTNKLITLEKSYIRKSINTQIELLLTRFKLPIKKGLILLGKERYILEDVTRYRKPYKYR